MPEINTIWLIHMYFGPTNATDWVRGSRRYTVAMETSNIHVPCCHGNHL